VFDRFVAAILGEEAGIAIIARTTEDDVLAMHIRDIELE